MITEVKAWIPGTAKAQPRARATVIPGSKHPRMYDPGTARGWQTAVLVALMGKLPSEPWTGPVWVTLRFYLPRPKGHWGSGRNAGELKASSPAWHTSKPDVDNLEKAVLDALSGRLWRDDSQVVSQHTRKEYADGPPGLELEARSP